MVEKAQPVRRTAEQAVVGRDAIEVVSREIRILQIKVKHIMSALDAAPLRHCLAAIHDELTKLELNE